MRQEPQGRSNGPAEGPAHSHDSHAGGASRAFAAALALAAALAILLGWAL